ncbi:MAG: hypothetical protein LBG60_05815 [Bifidobacteriaceae bacterium]|nr:hypothetical protein [Bifidobacteriaceae bacterium]
MPALVDAGAAAHEGAMDAKEASQLASNDAYGATYWLALFEEVFNRLMSLPNAAAVRPDRARYWLVSLGGVLVFPSRFGARSVGVSNLYLSPSKLRAGLLADPGHAAGPAQPAFDLGPEFGFGGITTPLFAVTQADKTVLVAYDCGPRAGLRHVYVGEVRSYDDADGRVTWAGTPEELPITAVLGLNHLAGLMSQRETLFDDAPVRPIGLQLVDGDRDVARGDDAE